MVALPRLNPVIAKELRSRMRGWRAIATLTAYLAVVGSFALLSLYVASQEPWLTSTAGLLGRSLFTNIAVAEIFLVCFITPAFTAGSIAGERERQTHDLLFTTLLASRSIVLGKFISSLAYILLLLVAALPIQGMVFLMGGVSVDELALTFGLLLVTTLGIGALSLLFSSIVRTTLPATVLSYATVLTIVIGTSMGFYMAGPIIRSTPPAWMVYPNPFSAVASVLSVNGGPSVSLPIPVPMPMPVPVETVIQVQPFPEKGMAGQAFAPGSPPSPVPVWKFYTAIYLAATVLSVAGSAILIKPTHPWLWRMKLRR